MKVHRMHRTKESQHADHKLYEAIAAIESVEEAQFFFRDLCTPAELQAMADRWRVVDLIMAGKPYRQIYEETGVSVTTIGRVARSMMCGEGGYFTIYQRSEQKSNENKQKKTVKLADRNTKKRAFK